MIRSVDDLADLGNLLLELSGNTFFQRQIRHSAALTTSAKTQHDPIPLDVDETHDTSVGSEARVDPIVEDFLHASRERMARERRLIRIVKFEA